MRLIGIVICLFLTVAAVQACRGNKPPEPVPSPKAARVRHGETGGISWFQGSFEEAFSRARRTPKSESMGLGIAVGCVGRD
jgi:hypothetical protein